MSKKKWITGGVAAIVIAVIGITFANAKKEVLVRTSDYEVTKKEYLNILKDLGLEDAPQIKTNIISQMVEGHVIAKLAKKNKLEETDSVQRKLSFMKKMILRDAYLSDFVDENLSDDAVKSEYDRRTKNASPVTEYHAAHILVADEAKIKDIKGKLDKGQDFVTLAKEFSTDSSAAKGGDLGFFDTNMMVKSFGDAVSTLKAGEISDPVKTDFGWHLIKLYEKREKEQVPFEQIKDRLKDEISQKFVAKHIHDLMAQAKVEYLDPSADPSPLKGLRSTGKPPKQMDKKKAP